MDFLKKNTPKTEVQEANAGKIREAENGWMAAKQAIDAATLELGRAYFEANRENTDSEFATQVETVNRRIKEEYLWHQYRLSLDGQRMCDSCKSFITSDSAFCNRCGATVAPIDFSPIMGVVKSTQSVIPVNQIPAKPVLNCPKCGKKLLEGARFCEACGTKIF